RALLRTPRALLTARLSATSSAKRMTRALPFVLALVFTACASRLPPAAPTAASTAFAQTVYTLMRRGCYRCLEQAFEQAQRLGARTQAFEAAALLTLRSKELGLPSDSWLDRARELTSAEPSLSPYLDMIDVVPPDRL